MSLHFILKDYCVDYNGEIVYLLRKEYYLLKYLFENANQPFTRSHLLDEVWKLETPSDRTIDDHIYRLRKKLKDWDNLISIDTVKGFGYQLSKKEIRVETAPVAYDKEFHILIEKLFNKYNLYGSGEAINALVNQKALNINMPVDYNPLIYFMKGDFWWFVQDYKHQMSSKLLFLIYLFSVISKDYRQTIVYIKNGLEKKLFPDHVIYEVENITLLYAYVFSREFALAKEQMTKIEKNSPEITEQSNDLYPSYLIISLIKAMCLRENKKVQDIIVKLDMFFSEKPYQRELGIYTVIKGLFGIQSGREKDGRADIEKGFETIKKTKYKSHIFTAIDICMFLLAEDVKDDLTHQDIYEKWKSLNKEYQFTTLIKSIKIILEEQVGGES
ncbi:winged helix-turn-helix domain-containing protein [Evansella tamaricis]|uniref:Winged helix-turn-helix domain-containing protein n=1 Tax=Evansella tamaricis TaxID=2069301 RepID=A0ABS6JIT9_9BACI|nr:winged helix-turn-helix domain-containing protein [Evansella tamaricis]MBU9713563.1 winged helix-turn-helix domain-containing protein [Evansella tamaricis]